MTTSSPRIPLSGDRRRLYKLVLSLLIVAGSALSLPVDDVLACSAGPDWDPIAESEVIVEGRIADWTARHDLRPAVDQKGQLEPSTFIPVELTLEVKHVFKGVLPGRFSFIDWASLTEYPGSPEGTAWNGGGGACGTFDFDPIGATVILGLNQGESGELRSHRLTTFYVGPASTGEHYEMALERLSALQPVAVATPTAESVASPTPNSLEPTAAPTASPTARLG